LTRDNLEKRRHVDDKSCLFCSDLESISHLFFECVVARKTWVMVSSVLGWRLGLIMKILLNIGSVIRSLVSLTWFHQLCVGACGK
jgi:hypothetical protein